MKRFLLMVLIAFFSLPSFAQHRWGGGVDYDKIHFGFSFHYVASSFKVFKTDNWQSPYPNPSVRGRLTEVSSPFKNGMGVGLITDLSLSENINLRFNPTIIFGGKSLNYNYSDSINQLSGEKEIFSKGVKASLLELPLTLKFKSDRRNNYRIYALGGGKYSHNVIPKSKLDDSADPDREKQVKLKSGFFSYEFGLGVDIYFDYFKMSPEIKWSQSFGNVMDKGELNAFNSPIDKLLLRSVQFSLIFE